MWGHAALNLRNTFKSREFRSGSLGGLVVVVLSIFYWFAPAHLSNRAELPAIDLIASLSPPRMSDDVVVVDIDSVSLESFGGRSLSRARLADLLNEITRLGAASIALDLVLAEPCDPQKSNVVRLTQTIEASRVSLGFLFSDHTGGPLPNRNVVAVDQKLRLPDVWSVPGAEMSCATYVDAARGVSAMALPGDFDARIRSMPLVVAVGGQALPSLAVDAIRLARKAGVVFLFGDPPKARLGQLQVPLDSSGSVRVRHSTQDQQSRRTISAGSIMDGATGGASLENKIVFVGSSAPELGGLRPVPGNPLTPSVQIHADLASSLLLASTPFKPLWAPALSIALAILLGTLLSFVAAMTRPIIDIVTSAGLFVAWLAICIFAYHRANIVLPPVLPAVAMIVGGMSGSLFQFSAVRRAEAIIRNRFEQRLPPSVVSKLVAEPALLKLRGETRLSTSMFTDVEGFTTMSEKMNASELIALLDEYFEGLTDIVIAHGGMVDRTIGDGLHAMFNAPVDLEFHADAAIVCAQTVLRFSEEFRRTPMGVKHNFGRTRIGIESGNVILGDVGAKGKIDYSAYGASVNAAARLQDANKTTGTSILVGAAANKLLQKTELFDHGEIELRGIGVIRIYSPEPMTKNRD